MGFVRAPLQRGGARIAAWLHQVLRSNAFGHVIVAIVVGAISGLGVTLMTKVAETAHVLIYHIAFDERLSASARVPLVVAAAALGIGGAIVGLMDRHRRSRELPPTVDPIEANALHGGRLSMRDGLFVAMQTLISNGCGASVGLEAGYAQIGAAIGSRLGQWQNFRRHDLRMMVGAGAGAAIAAAFGAPLTGSFYAFELIVGAYSLVIAGPVIAASVSATLVVHALGGAPYSVSAPPVPPLEFAHYAALIVLGGVSVALGVATMRAAAGFDRLFELTRLPRWLRPALGGVIVAGLAAVTPQVLGAGHGALGLDVPLDITALALAGLIAIKLLASLISLGSGFRGGLFFASLFIGALLGKLFAIGANAALPTLGLDPTACMFGGMATFGVAIVGGPLTMTFLVLESSGDLAITGGVLAASIATSLLIRSTFGYSFSTWRLHLRGETISGAQDVGWRRELTVARLMDRDPAQMSAKASVAEFCLAHPLGSAHVVVLTDPPGTYAGLVFVPEAHAAAPGSGDAVPIASVARQVEVSLRPDMDVKAAMIRFESAQSDVLAVTDGESGALLGTLTEAYASRRYAEAVDMAARGILDAA